MAIFIEAIRIMETDYLLDEVFGERLLINYNAVKNELNINIRAARAILCSYSEVCIRINAHTYCMDIRIQSIPSAMTLEIGKE